MDISALRERRDGGAFSVSELNSYIKAMFDGNKTLASVTVRAEISNFVAHRSGHFYFSLKDSESQIRAVMFRSAAMNLKFQPENGMRLIVHGSVSVYPRDGSYQLYVNSMQPDGIGALYVAYEQLKAKLEGEGLFSASSKKPIPSIPRAIGVITSPTGAAVRDIINVATRRYPAVKIYVYPATVQGDGAEETLIRALDYFDSSSLVDTVIIGRGGGSIEDLWAFNGEKLARRIYDMKIPVISAVGHETDFTICDFVADLRAPTPSAAAELAVPDMRELMQMLDFALEKSSSAILRRLERLRERIADAAEVLSADTAEELIQNKRDRVSDAFLRAGNILLTGICEYRNRLMLLSGKADSMSPLSVLARGYSIVEKNKKSIANASELSLGDEVYIRLSRGKATAEIKQIEVD